LTTQDKNKYNTHKYRMVVRNNSSCVVPQQLLRTAASPALSAIAIRQYLIINGSCATQQTSTAHSTAASNRVQQQCGALA
jgi:hypothetical protein